MTHKVVKFIFIHLSQFINPIMKKHIILASLLALCSTSFAQNYDEVLGQEGSSNAINTAVTFLLIAPDSRAGAMGDAGVATTPDAYSQAWNSSKLAFAEKPYGLAITYVPWLRQLINDMNLAYLSGFVNMDKNQTIGASLRYFTMGNVNFTDNSGNSLGSYSPHEFALDASYNRRLTDNFSLGMAGRFILSNLTGGQAGEGAEATQSGKTFAIDINGFYTDKLKLGDYAGSWAAGFNISNLGPKLGYTADEKNFIPTNLRIGGSMTIEIDQYNKFMAAVDINKLLVPTPPRYYQDSTDEVGNRVIYKGKSNNVGVIAGALQSFNDAPDGFKEELHEFNYSIGGEYVYADQFAVRAGYFHENKTKGNRKYFTAGIGLKMNVLGLDFSYLIPAGNFSTSPLRNTWRFSLTMDFENLK